MDASSAVLGGLFQLAPTEGNYPKQIGLVVIWRIGAHKSPAQWTVLSLRIRESTCE
jgi:hypothetical protein